MTEPTPPTWPHERVGPDRLRDTSGHYYIWSPATETWRIAESQELIAWLDSGTKGDDPMTEPTPPTWPHEPVAPGWVRTPDIWYYYWEPETDSWRAASVLVIGRLIDELRAELDAERQRAEQAERERDELRAIMKEGHTRKACVRREPVYSMRCSACRALARAEAAEQQARELKAALLPCMQALPTIGRYVALRKQAKAALEATASPEPSVTEGRRE